MKILRAKHISTSAAVTVAWKEHNFKRARLITTRNYLLISAEPESKTNAPPLTTSGGGKNVSAQTTTMADLGHVTGQ